MDEAYTLCLDSYRTHGNSIIGLRRHFGWGEDMEHRFMEEVTATFLAQLDQHLQPHQPTIALLERIQPRTSLLAVFTANSHDYACAVLRTTALDHLFAKELIVGRGCIGAIHKYRPEAYEAFLKRTEHLPADTLHIMAEDSPANLPAAKQTGFITVLVGNKPCTDEQARAVDYHFPSLEHALEEMLR